MGASEGGRRFRLLTTVVLATSFVYGVLVGSYIRHSSADGRAWRAPLKLLDLNDFDSMMRLSIGIGSAHLILANLDGGDAPAAFPP